MANNTTTNEIIAKVGELLREEMSYHNILKLEALRFDIASAKADANQNLSEQRNRLLMPKTKETTELDRTTALEGSVAHIKRDCDLLEEIQFLIKDRIDLFKGTST